MVGVPRNADASDADRWGWIFAYGTLLAIIGVVAIGEPLATGFVTGFFLGVALIVSGIAGIAAGFSRRGWRSNWLDNVVGSLSLLLGLLVLINPFAGAVSIVWAIGVWLIAIGILEVSAALRSAHHRAWLSFVGLVDALLGIALLLAGPATALAVLATIVGISFILRGVFLALFALWLRRGPDRAGMRP
ncbi:DUF308 domain-containing protein [Sphingobium sp.]|uniref:HdeD family acid-resistance protein n=1 Tax=Sphingobium sp. TaxID=1912891 RepID=UPI000DB491AB|nr:DUF308 domain-containing protein [Sphingobium sp.]PZU64026.1 MAG: hypothetical protein DI540_21825 [Sphingobium sp.]